MNSSNVDRYYLSYIVDGELNQAEEENLNFHLVYFRADKADPLVKVNQKITVRCI